MDKFDTINSKTLTVSSYRTSNHVIEEIYDESRVPEKQFTVYSQITKQITYHDRVELENGSVLIPNQSPLIDNKVILLAEEAVPFESVSTLLNEIKTFILKYLDIHPFYHQMIPYYVLLTWVYDRLSVIPYLRAIGDYGTGKTRFVQVVGSLCYNPMFIAGAVTVSPIFRMIEQFQGTMVFNEMDMSERNNDLYSDLTKILNCGFEKHLTVMRTEGEGKKDVKIYKTFCPKIFAMRTKFGDHALESRIFSIPMQQTTRSDIPRFLNEDFWYEALQLRNKLLMYRLTRSSDEITTDRRPELDGIEPRLEQTITPIISVIENEQDVQSLIEFTRRFQEQLITDRGLDLDVVVASKLIELLESTSPVTVKMVTDEVNKDFPERRHPYTSHAVGKIIRSNLNYKTKKSGGTYQVVYDAQHTTYLKKRFGIESPLSPQNPLFESNSDVDSVDSVDLPQELKINSNLEFPEVNLG